jgi:hypothetical protein
MKENNKISFKVIWGIFMFFVYMCIGYFVIFTPLFLPYNFRDNLKENDDFVVVRMILGIGIFAYALFRAYNIWREIKK